MRCQGLVANVARARTLKFQTNVSTTLYVRYRSVYVWDIQYTRISEFGVPHGPWRYKG